jgi:hypothetical protein
LIGGTIVLAIAIFVLERAYPSTVSSIQRDATSEVIDSRTTDKETWKAVLAKLAPAWAAGGPLVVQKNIFLKKFGKPTRNETEEDTVFWYYECTDGAIQLELNSKLLAFGLVSGHVNDN